MFLEREQMMATYRLFPTTDGPATPVAYTGNFASGVAFEVTSGGMWFEGYWWWVCPSGQPTAPQTFALWQVYIEGTASIISEATVTSGPLTAGQWNYIPLDNPIMLSVGGGANFADADAGGTAVYIACTGFTGGFPDTNSQFGAGDPFAAGITNGPLTAFSDQSGSKAAPWSVGQGLFSVNNNITSDPPFNLSNSSNFWMDVQVGDTAPGDYTGSYRIWPSQPVVPGGPSNDTGQQTFGTEFWLSQTCEVNNIWLWSPPGAANLPTRCGIFSVSTQQEVSGSDNSSPAWVLPGGGAASAGDGWIRCSYASSGLSLPAGKYKVCVAMAAGGKAYQEDVYYFGTGPGANNIVNGPITVPNNANAAPCMANSGPNPTVTGNSTYQDGPWAYPYTFDVKDNGENRYVDIEVTPGGGSASPVVNSGAFLTFFP
jgi:hypothetical protein